MSHRRRLTAVPLIAAAVVGMTLSACAQVTLTATDPSPSASASASASPSVEPSPSETSSPSPSPSSLPSTFPADCVNVVAQPLYDGFFQGTPLNDPGFVDPAVVGPIAPVPPPSGATPGEIVDSAVELRCVWRDPNADITGISIQYSRVAVAVATTYMADLASQGYTCSDVNGGRQCQLVQPNEQYPVDESFTVLARDGVIIDVRQANFETVDLMAALAAEVWGQ